MKDGVERRTGREKELDGRLRGFVLASFVDFLNKLYKRIPNAFGNVQSLRHTSRVLGTSGYLLVRTVVGSRDVMDVGNWPDGHPWDGDTLETGVALSGPLGQ